MEWRVEFTFKSLVGGLEHFLFFHILGIIIPTDFHIFQRGRLNPPTRSSMVKITCFTWVARESPVTTLTGLWVVIQGLLDSYRTVLWVGRAFFLVGNGCGAFICSELGWNAAPRLKTMIFLGLMPQTEKIGLLSYQWKWIWFDVIG